MAYILDVLLTQDSVIIQEKYFNIFLGSNKIRGKTVNEICMVIYIYIYITFHSLDIFKK